mgnify:CR=1 FL=1|tara:strand:+ start:1114 stop:1710 length:597 start_codon:yes stop_codon:yes gene_type:complete
MDITREQWLNEVAEFVQDDLIAPLALKYFENPLEPRFRLTVAKMASKRLGECYIREVSADSNNEIQITMACDDSLKIAETITHELIHAADNCQSGHKNWFAFCARKVGLIGKLTATSAGPELAAQLNEYITLLGPIPHAKMTLTPRGKGRNNSKIHCPCGFKANLSNTWASQVEQQIKHHGKGQCPVCLHDSLNITIK